MGYQRRVHGQSLEPSQNEQSQSVGGFLPGSCSVSFLTEFYLPSIVSFRSAKQHVERHPKLFFVSTSSTTSTLSTASLCYVTSTTFQGDGAGDGVGAGGGGGGGG